MMWGYHDFGFAGGPMGIGMLLFWVLIIGAVVVLVRGLFGGGSGGAKPYSRNKTAIEILRERYARGEIDKGEFEQKRRDLEAA